MSRAAAALRPGLARGLIELRQAFAGPALIGQLFWPAATLAAIFFLRHKALGGTRFDLGTLVLPGVLGMYTALGMVLMIQYLTAEREDGTLLRAKTVPNGIRGYFLGKLVTVSGSIGAYLAMLTIPGLLLVGGLDLGRARTWLTLAWVLPLGLVATQSIGAAVGSVISGPRAAGYIALLVTGLIAISGIFYPITSMPRWLQGTAQVFPVYWLGLGVRSALLPASAASVEIGHSWRQLATLGVLGAWGAAGLVAAPLVLRRMARRESGSSLARRREKAVAQAR